MIKKETEKQIWDQQEKEPKKAFNHFIAYLDLGRKRTLPSLSEKIGLSMSRLRTLSAKYKWVSRADQYDEYFRKQELLKEEEYYKKKLEMKVKIVANLMSDKEDIETDLYMIKSELRSMSFKREFDHKRYNALVNARHKIVKESESIIKQITMLEPSLNDVTERDPKTLDEIISFLSLKKP